MIQRVILIYAMVSPFAQAGEMSSPSLRRVAPGETWSIQRGRFFQQQQWVFLKTGKMLRSFQDPATADKAIADIDVMIDELGFNNFSLNIYPDAFDEDADGKIDESRRVAYLNVGRILDHCWRRGVFCCLSFETYNVGGGGTPVALFQRFHDLAARNALNEPAHDVEYFDGGKLIPSIFHPAYLEWSRSFLKNFLNGLGSERVSRLLYVETTVEPQYLGRCNFLDHDDRRAFLDFSAAAEQAFNKYKAGLPANDPDRPRTWPSSQAERDRCFKSGELNRFRATALAAWVSGDAQAIRSVAPNVYIAVDYNGRADDPRSLRLGAPELFLSKLQGVDIIQVAPHTPEPWGPESWEQAIRINQRENKRWAISEHMTATGDWAENDETMTKIFDNTLARGTRWGWEFVNAGNQRERDRFNLYERNWKSPVLDVIDRDNWQTWLRKIGAPRFVPTSRPVRQASAG